MAAIQLISVWLLMSVCNLASATERKNRTVHILCLLPYNEPPFNPSFSDGPQLRLALEMAKNEINNQSLLLPDYQIELIHANSACQITNKAYEALLTNVYSRIASENIVGLIGPGCSGSSRAVSSIINREQLSLVTVHSGGSFELANRTLYPNALGALGSTEAFAQLVLQLMITRKWTKIVVFFEETRSFYSSMSRRVEELTSSFSENLESDKKLHIVSTAVDETYLPLEQRTVKSMRIKLLLTARNVTLMILCLARRLGMVYPAHQWIVIVNTFDEIAVSVNFTYNGTSYTCSESEMKAIALNRSLFLVYQLSAINETLPSTHSKHTFQEYDQIIRNGIEEYNLQNVSASINYSVWTTYFYDSLWAWSVVLDRLAKRLPHTDLASSNYGNTMLTDAILEEFYNLNFEGVSGRMNFWNTSGFVQRPVAILQIFNSTPKAVAYLQSGNNLTGDLESIPYNFDPKDIHVSTLVVGLVIGLALVQLVVLATLNVLTLVYRDYPSVKASSLKFNQLIFIGCYLLSLTIILFTVYSSHLVEHLSIVIEVLCNVTWYWFLPLSLTLSFGTVAVRTWRLYRIFTHFINPGRFIADHYLISFVLILVAVDVFFGIILSTLNQQFLILVEIPIEAGNATFQVNIRTCRSEMPWLTIVLLFGYRGILMLAVLILSFMTTKILNPSFTTKSLRILIYLVTAVMVLGFVIYYIFYFRYLTIMVTFYSFVITLNVVLMLFIALICTPPLLPKLKDMYRRHARKRKRLFSFNSEIFKIS